MEESDYVWRPAFLDSVGIGDWVQVPENGGWSMPWKVTDLRNEITEGLVAIIGTEADGEPHSFVSKTYRPVCKREFAVAEVAPDPEPQDGEWAELANHLAGEHYDAAVPPRASLDDLLAVHDTAHDGTTEVGHIHELPHGEENLEFLAADRLRGADFDTGSGEEPGASEQVIVDYASDEEPDEDAERVAETGVLFDTANPSEADTVVIR